jgi:predicted MFS family arabinose efflux permease
VRLTRDPRYRWMVVAMAFLAILAAVGFGRFGYGAILPSMQKALGLTGAQAGSLASWNQVGYTLMALVGGILASRLGARIIVSIGLFLTALAMFGTGLANGLGVASVARFLTGAGTAMVMCPSIALMAAWFAPRRLGMASGIIPSGASLALVLVGPVVPRLIAAGGGGGWRLAWYLFAGITFLVAIASTFAQRDRPHAQCGTHVARLTFSDLRDIARSRWAWLLGTVYFLYGFAFLLFFTFFQKRLTIDLGYSNDMAGNLLLVVGATGVVAGVLWGRVSDSIGRGRSMAAILFVQAAVALVFALAHSLAALVVASAVFGLSGMGVPGLFGAACGDRFGARLAAASLGFVTVFVGVGQIIGPYVGGALEDNFSSLAPSYVVSAGVFVLAGVVALMLRDSPPPMQSAHTSCSS